MPDEFPQETFPQEAAGRLHSPSSRPLPGSFPGRSGIGDVDLSRLPKPLLGGQSASVRRAPPNAWPLDLAPHPSTPLPTAIASLTSCHETPSRHQVVLGGHQDVAHLYRVASIDRSSHGASPFELRSCSLCSQLS
ncbi:hypothetical protein T4E_10312 [Trichinella pseudospiralis]|uniref:Uncharacterized protein n=1 Tax=Trichinella pseudospiralis TaxID=6337 RepID=A0A0V0XEM1_TRIPS|nr:hypothetical protein T4E_10312 [Trichinella pseudospiralis]